MYGDARKISKTSCVSNEFRVLLMQSVRFPIQNTYKDKACVYAACTFSHTKSIPGRCTTPLCERHCPGHCSGPSVSHVSGTGLEIPSPDVTIVFGFLVCQMSLGLYSCASDPKNLGHLHKTTTPYETTPCRENLFSARMRLVRARM